MSNHLEQRSDGHLVELCMQGDELAWKELVERHQRSLYLSILEQLREKGKDLSRVEDIAQEVWFLLVDEQYQRLGLYDPQRGGFDTFLKALVTQVIQKQHRDEGTHIKLQGSVEDHEPVESTGNAGLVQAEFAEYVEDLTPQESRCLQEKMLGNPSPTWQAPIAPGNERVLRHRLQRKWKDHID